MALCNKYNIHFNMQFSPRDRELQELEQEAENDQE